MKLYKMWGCLISLIFTEGRFLVYCFKDILNVILKEIFEFLDFLFKYTDLISLLHKKNIL